MSATRRPHLSDTSDDRIARYQTLSRLAVAGLACGLLAPLWLIDPWLWVLPVPALGILLSALAFWRIDRDSALTGRRLAWVGLVLAVFFTVAGPTHWLVYRGIVRQEAQEFAMRWFDLLAEGQAAHAYRLTLHPTIRLPLDDPRLDAILPGGHESLDYYSSRPLVETLLNLGEDAQVRYVESLAQHRPGTKDLVTQRYAITYRDRDTGEMKTFHASLIMQREPLKTGRADWQLMGTKDDLDHEAPSSTTSP